MMGWTQTVQIILKLMSCFILFRFAHSKMLQQEIDALQEITSTMGATYWKFNDDLCQIETVGTTPTKPEGSESSVDCECTFDNSTTCRVVRMTLEANEFSGNVPVEFQNLQNLETLMLSSNQFTGRLPATFAGLKNLTDFRINDNNFSGPIPEFIQNWSLLTRLEMCGSGLEGPIPSNISVLEKLIDLRITDIKSPIQRFPDLSRITGIIRLVLRSCNISGVIPAYLWKMQLVEVVDASFNSLVGEIPDDISGKSLRMVFLTGNMLSGNIPESILKDGYSVDLSYNNFTWQGPEQPTCRSNMNYYINLFKSSSTGNPLRGILPCTEDLTCPKYGCSLHVNSGGNDLQIKENSKKVLYEGDAEAEGGSARYYRSNNFWGFSSTGDFMDDNNYQNTRYIKSLPSANIPDLYNAARLSPVSLTYFRYCLQNGSYAVSLHFSEIQFTNSNNYSKLGKRKFNIYVQGELVEKDFNIEDEVGGAQRPVIKQYNASVSNNIIEIRFYWAGKGTTRIPSRGVYGPLISAISVNPNFKSCKTGGKKNSNVYLIVGVVAFCVTALAITILWWKGCFKGKKSRGKDFEAVELQTVCFSLKHIKAATNNFDAMNKIGEGGFGSVYKGTLSDGKVIAVKQLSSQSRQGNREFLNEVAMISCVQHPNLVKLYGCCIEGDQLLLVYEFMENNSLANALFSSENNQLLLDWPTRFKICIGIARGLAFLHEESRLKIVHRDIKATNVLLDRDLNPKISDFGLAKLNDKDKSHISTRVAGTMYAKGYMAPEYALWGYLSDKADVYSFGVVALEIVSGKNNNNYMPSEYYICLLDWACHLQESKKYEELVDESLGSKVDNEEAVRMVKVALLCTNTTPSIRPIMSEVVSMLEGQLSIPDITPETNTNSDDLRFKALRDFHQGTESQSFFTRSQTEKRTPLHTQSSVKRSSSTSLEETLEIQPDRRPH
ncbi:putative LRR receptor-like serine/threonine-protein kinase RFK1 isoform X3 [Apium graveolens]|uniref:putative LRR receptor-like serine/threonine-protein kinase RFK1 isoform X3 n=1 Tax=Apium graveolens TaxID=4045 RepID=UPI003D79AB45